MIDIEKYKAPNGALTVTETGEFVEAKGGYVFCKFLDKVIDVGYCYEINVPGVDEKFFPDKITRADAEKTCEACKFGIVSADQNKSGEKVA
jgi:hypothetical protein